MCVWPSRDGPGMSLCQPGIVCVWPLWYKFPLSLTFMDDKGQSMATLDMCGLLPSNLNRSMCELHL